MKIVEFGKVKIDKEKDIPMFEEMGCKIDWHTPYYLNGITASFGTFQVGFHNWLDGADIWIGNKEVKLKSMREVRDIISLMKALINTNRMLEKVT